MGTHGKGKSKRVPDRSIYDWKEVPEDADTKGVPKEIKKLSLKEFPGKRVPDPDAGDGCSSPGAGYNDIHWSRIDTMISTGAG